MVSISNKDYWEKPITISSLMKFATLIAKPLIKLLIASK